MDQDIIEKRASSPVETTLLALAASFMIGAIVLMGMEIAELSHKDYPSETAAGKYAQEKLTGYTRLISSLKLKK